MLTCKQVSRSLERQDYRDLGWFSRAMLRLHVATCVVCGKYNRQRMMMHDTIRAFLGREDRGELPVTDQLAESDRERMKKALRQEGH